MSSPVYQRNTGFGGIKNNNFLPNPEFMRNSSLPLINSPQANSKVYSAPCPVGLESENSCPKYLGINHECGAQSVPAQEIKELFVDLTGPILENDVDGPITENNPQGPSELDSPSKQNTVEDRVNLDSGTSRVGPVNSHTPLLTGNSKEEDSEEDSEITSEARRAWEVGKRLGLISKVTDEDMISQMEYLERKDRQRSKKTLAKPSQMLSYNVRGLGKKAKRREKQNWKRCRRLDARGYGNNDVFQKSSSWSVRGVLVINGFFTEDGGRGVQMNVYAPCSSSEKSKLWEIIKQIVHQNMEARICVVGDFNSIRRPEERVGRREAAENRDIQCFEEFIQQSNLQELNLVGSSFTWYCLDGSCKSKIDRMFLNNYSIEGWAAYRLKEKLKLLKKDLREWNKCIFGDIDHNIESRMKEIEVLDRIDDAMGLEEAEVIQRNKNTVELIRFVQWKEKLLAQKAKAKWLKEGEVNSSYFHGWTDSVDDVKKVIREHFEQHFRKPVSCRPQLPIDIFSRSIDECSNQLLTARFTEEEIKEAVWTCDSKKSPSPDGYSFERVDSQVYGRNRGRGRYYGNMSGWWRELCNLYVGDEGRGVKQDMFRVVGNGKSTKFWRDIWVGTEPLSRSYNRLFRVSNQQEECIDGMGRWTETGWEWDMKWRRGLRESDQVLLTDLIDGIFSTASAYQKCWKTDATDSEEQNQKITYHRLWNSFAPRRYRDIVWKILHNQLPTKDRLQRMGII
ncbi:hypothetical protein ACS0TY_025822 [Phlomoides rotata]